MTFSLITVCYNSSKYIRSAIESVLSQTYPNIEYILVDGGSTDSTLNIIKEYESRFNGRMRWISEPDNGLYDAMNKGIRMATGDVVGLVNSDDLLCDPRAIEKAVRVFAENESLDAVFADLYYVAQNDTDKIVRRWTSGEQKPFRLGWHPAHPTLYLKKEVYEKYGYFNLDYKLAADYEIMLRFLEKYKIKSQYLPEPFMKMRLGGATNKNIKNIYLQNLECIRAFKENDLPVCSLMYPLFRLLPKLMQFKSK